MHLTVANSNHGDSWRATWKLMFDKNLIDNDGRAQLGSFYIRHFVESHIKLWFTRKWLFGKLLETLGHQHAGKHVGHKDVTKMPNWKNFVRNWAKASRKINSSHISYDDLDKKSNLIYVKSQLTHFGDYFAIRGLRYSWISNFWSFYNLKLIRVLAHEHSASNVLAAQSNSTLSTVRLFIKSYKIAMSTYSTAGIFVFTSLSRNKALVRYLQFDPLSCSLAYR